MRKFADIHVKLRDLNNDVLTRTGQLAYEMGIDLLGIVVPNIVDKAELSTIKSTVGKTGVDTVIRIDLNPKDRNQLLSNLRSARKRFEIVAVECRSLQVATVACRDRRVDIVSFPINSLRIRFRESLARVCRGSVELDMAPLILTEEPSRHVILSRLRDDVLTANRNHVPVVLSSGADNPLLLRAPRELAAIGTLFGLDSEEALDSVSRIPFGIMERNRKKLSAGYVSIGVSAKMNETNA
jgi:ribonuclease P/MRP protein subunit RPP1